MTESTPILSLLLSDANGERRLDLAEGSYVFGRDATADCVLDSKRLSRQHLRLDVHPEGLVAEDLMSANGSLLNGRHIARPTPVAMGDVIEMGDVRLKVEFFEAPVAKPSPRTAAPQKTPRPAARPVSSGGERPVSSGSSVRLAPPRKSATRFITPIVCIGLLIGGGWYAMNSGLLSGGASGGGASAAAPKGRPNAAATAAVDHRVHECITSEDFRAADDALRDFESRWGEENAKGLRTVLDQAIERAAADTEREATRQKSSDPAAAIAYLDRRLRTFPENDRRTRRLADVKRDIESAGEPAVADAAGEKASAAAADAVPAAPVQPAPAPEKPAAKGEKTAAAPSANAANAAPEKPVPPADRPVTAEAKADARKRYTELRPRADVLWADKDYAGAAPVFADLEGLAKTAGLTKAVIGDTGRRRRTAERFVRFGTSVGAALAANGAKFADLPAGGAARGRLVKADANGLTLDVQGETRAIAWKALTADLATVLIRKSEFDMDGDIDAAGVLLVLGDTGAAHKLLHLADQKYQAAAHPPIDQVLADDLGIELPKTPFVWVDDAYLSPADFARIGAQKVIDRETARLASNSAKERADAYGKLEALGDVARSAYHRALSAAKAEFAKKLSGTATWKKVQSIVDAHAEVEKLREAALTLIFDEEKYPYPYHGAGVSPEATKNFEETQRKIDDILAQLRKVWNDEKAVTIDRELQDARERVREFDEHLTKLGLGMGTDAMNVLHFLPPTGDMNIRNYAHSADERFRIDESNDWIKRNEKDTDITTKNELDEIRVTNEYRLMMGRHALRIHPLLMKSARMHSDDMVRLGFFDHMNDKEPEKRTPWDRMKYCGFKGAGAGENLAISGGPTAAHNSWLHSSGHHRNILEPGHRLFGVGNNGRHWTQNFSSSAEDEAPLFSDGGTSKPADVKKMQMTETK